MTIDAVKGVITACKFQSTPSSRKVTARLRRVSDICPISIHTFLAEGDASEFRLSAETAPISIHTFLAEGDPLWRMRYAVSSAISIHTFLAEGDYQKHPPRRLRGQFQSTPSSRKVTTSGTPSAYIQTISIHTFLAEGDSDATISPISVFYFNPHLPRGR